MKSRVWLGVPVGVLFGMILTLALVHLSLTYVPKQQIEVWRKGEVAVMFDLLVGSHYPWWWRFSPERGRFVDELRKQFQALGWERERKYPGAYTKVDMCFLQIYAGGSGFSRVPNFKIFRKQVTKGDYLEGTYEGSRYSSLDVKDLEEAVSMCK